MLKIVIFWRWNINKNGYNHIVIQTYASGSVFKKLLRQNYIENCDSEYEILDKTVTMTLLLKTDAFGCIFTKLVCFGDEIMYDF